MIDTSKVIHAPVGGGRYTVTAPIVKEDYGLYLKIEGLELPSTYEVDFSNSEHNGTSVTMIGNADGVLIPNQFISSGKDVFAFLYHVGVDFGRTVYKFRIPNKLRPDRTDETPTPEEQSVIDQAIAALNDAVEQTAQAVEDADASAQSAKDDADRAEQAKDDASTFAQRSANSAQASADYSESAQASASASAQSASQSAQIKADVEELVDDAQGYANSASQSASQASASEQGCARAVLDAASAAAIARARADEASGYAQTASTKASEASTSASTASAKATESAQSASQALTYKTDAESAKTASQTAQGLAESARDSAISAKIDAESARDEAQSIVDGISEKVEQIDQNTADIASLEEDIYKPYVVDSASGAIASFTDGADDIPLKSLVVNIDPVQDLHGYDSPWVGGGGKNLFDADTIYAQFKQSDGSFIGLGNDIVRLRAAIPESLVGTELTFSAYMLMPSGSTITNIKVAAIVGGTTKSGNVVTSDSYTRSTVTFTPTSASDAVLITFGSNGGQNMQFKDVQLEKGSSATSFAPYENICPITGWTECNIDATGKNLLDADKYYGNYKQSDGSYLLSANNLTNIQIPLKAFIGKTVTFSAETTIGATPKNLRARAYINGRWANGNSATQNATSITSITVTPVTDDDYIYITFGSDGSGAVTLRNVQMEEGSAVTDYEQFGTPVTIPLGQTVYGGKLDVLSGVMRVEYTINNLGDLNWTKYVNNTKNYFYALPNPKAMGVGPGTLPNGICSHYARLQYSDVCGISPLNGFNIASSTHIVYIHDNALAEVTASEFKTAMSGVQLCYELAEHIEIQLDAHTINSLYGTNNIFADTGDSAVEYRADTRLYIEKLTQPEEDDMIADSAITSGQFFMIGNSLYRALANIASGATITVGTNAQRVSLADALNLINT